jgi:DNA repair protein RadC
MSNSTSVVELDEDQLIHHACRVLEQRLKYRSSRGDNALESPDAMRDLLRLRLAEREHEVFVALFLDNRHRLIAYEEMFRGTVDGASVHPREVVKAALRHNAVAAVFAHNHPSGVADPSESDKRITTRLREALALIDVRVLDHFVVGDSLVSFAEQGLL